MWAESSTTSRANHRPPLSGSEPRLALIPPLGRNCSQMDSVDFSGEFRERTEFKGAIEAADHAIFFTDGNGAILYVNPAFERLTGYAAEEAIGKTPRILQSGLQSEEYYERMWKVLANGQTWQEEIANRRKNGSVYRAFQIISPIRDVNGELTSFVGIQHDITAQKELEEQLRHTLAEQSVIFDNTQDALFLVDVIDETQFRFAKLNPAHEQLTGLYTSKVRGKSPEEVLDSPTAEAVLQRYRQCVEKRRTITYEETLELPTGRAVWSTQLSPIFTDGRVTQLVGSSRNITGQKEMEMRLRYLSDADALTGINNRRRMMEELSKEMERSRRYGHPFALLMVDIDRFKSINDKHGHSVGDAVLVGFTETVKGVLRPTDSFGRWGGEEFLLLLSETDKAGAVALAERLRIAVSEEELLPDLGITVSIGIATCNGESRTKDDLINSADAALYRAKRSGRDRVIQEIAEEE